MNIIHMSLRNISRNRRRTLLIGLIISLGLAAMIFTDALTLGTEDNMVNAVTKTLMGDGQIHREGFRKTMDIEKTVHNADEQMQSLMKNPQVLAVAPRALSSGMISSPSNSTSILLYGIKPSSEERLSKLAIALYHGSVDSLLEENKILLGRKMAETLAVVLGDKIIITVAQAVTGDMSQEVFRVSGLFEFGVRNIDNGMGFISLPAAQKLLNIGDGVHEIAIGFKNRAAVEQGDPTFWQRYSSHGNEALSWRRLVPQLDVALGMSAYATFIIGIILFIIISFSIMNTLFMSIYERMFEFGVMKAMGTRPMTIFRMIIIESCCMGIVSIGIGIILGFIVTYAVGVIGIDYRGMEFIGAALTEKVHPVLRLQQFIIFPIVVVLFTAVAGIYPAIVAARIVPAQALKKD